MFFRSNSLFSCLNLFKKRSNSHLIIIYFCQEAEKMVSPYIGPLKFINFPLLDEKIILLLTTFFLKSR